jgi:hypothetical protein
MLLKQSLLITFIALLFHFNTFAQTSAPRVSTIKGEVKDDKGSVVSFVTVRVDGTNIATFSEENGKFELKNVPYGHRNIVITSVEIKPQTIKLQVHRPVQDIKIVVEKSTQDLNEVNIVHKTEKKKIETEGFAFS